MKFFCESLPEHLLARGWALGVSKGRMKFVTVNCGGKMNLGV
jgi:hypothetical protein